MTTAAASSEDFPGRALRWNAGYTALCGAAALLFGPALAAALGVADVRFLWGTGAFLLVVAGAMALVARRRQPLAALLLTLGDVGYVAASVGLVLCFPAALGSAGKEVVLLVALGVVGFVVAQGRGLWRLRRAEAGAGA